MNQTDEVVAKGTGVTWRAVLLGLVLIPFNAYWVVVMELVHYQGHPTTTSVFFNVVLIILVLRILNGLVARWRESWALSQGELLTLYGMLAVSSAVAGHDMLQVLAPRSFIRFTSLLPKTGGRNCSCSIFHNGCLSATHRFSRPRTMAVGWTGGNTSSAGRRRFFPGVSL